MKQTFLLLIIVICFALPMSAYNFEYTYQGQTLIYQVVNQEAKTCKVYRPGYIDGILSIPQVATDGNVNYTVTKIGDYCFYGRADIKEVNIPNSITEIGYMAFYNCANLSKVQLGNSLTKVGECSFYGCSSIKELSLPNSVTEIGMSCFYDCASLEKLQLSNSITRIESFAFYGCSSLTELNIPISVTEIGGWSFYGGENLTEINIPSSVTEIGSFAFTGCSNLTLTIENIDAIQSIDVDNIKNVIAYSYDTNGFAIRNAIKSHNSTLYVPIGSIGHYVTNHLGFKNYEWWNPDEHKPQYVEPDKLPTGIYFGILSFNNKLAGIPMDPLYIENKDKYKNFVNDMSTDFATLLYYGVEESLNALQYHNYPQDLGNIILVTFTDGLDQGSLAMNNKYNNSIDYASALAWTIKNMNVNSRRLKAYTIGLASEDAMSDPILFQNNLASLASENQNSVVALNMTQVKHKLDDLCEKIVTEKTQRVLSITVPMLSNGDQYRFTMDYTTTDATTSKLYFEGKFSSNGNVLTGVHLEGFTCDYENAITSEQDGIYITFTLRDCRTPDGMMLNIASQDINQWQYSQNSGKWIHNRENIRDVKIEDVTISTAIILALDASNSLGDEFGKLKEIACDFIDRLAESSGSSVEEIETDAIAVDSDAPVEYYNLQGQRVSNPTHGIFIRRQGNTVKKIAVK